MKQQITSAQFGNDKIVKALKHENDGYEAGVIGHKSAI
jgi:hypothetical protein